MIFGFKIWHYFLPGELLVCHFWRRNNHGDAGKVVVVRHGEVVGGEPGGVEEVFHEQGGVVGAVPPLLDPGHQLSVPSLDAVLFHGEGSLHLINKDGYTFK